MELFRPITGYNSSKYFRNSALRLVNASAYQFGTKSMVCWLARENLSVHVRIRCCCWRHHHHPHHPHHHHRPNLNTLKERNFERCVEKKAMRKRHCRRNNGGTGIWKLRRHGCLSSCRRRKFGTLSVNSKIGSRCLLEKCGWVADVTACCCCHVRPSVTLLNLFFN